jgi:hypothetical protein
VLPERGSDLGVRYPDPSAAFLPFRMRTSRHCGCLGLLCREW